MCTRRRRGWSAGSSPGSASGATIIRHPRSSESISTTRPVNETGPRRRCKVGAWRSQAGLADQRKAGAEQGQRRARPRTASGAGAAQRSGHRPALLHRCRATAAARRSARNKPRYRRRRTPAATTAGARPRRHRTWPTARKRRLAHSDAAPSPPPAIAASAITAPPLARGETNRTANQKVVSTVLTLY